jgi:hypothetical protein
MPSKQAKSKKSKSQSRRSSHAVECSRILASAEKQKPQTGGLILSRLYMPDIGMSPTAIIRRDEADVPLTFHKDTPTITPLKDIDESWDILEKEDFKENGKFDHNFTGEDVEHHLMTKSTDSDQWVVLKASPVEKAAGNNS